MDVKKSSSKDVLIMYLPLIMVYFLPCFYA